MFRVCVRSFVCRTALLARVCWSMRTVCAIVVVVIVVVVIQVQPPPAPSRSVTVLLANNNNTNNGRSGLAAGKILYACVGRIMDDVNRGG